MTHEELAQRIEKAEGPDRALFEEAFVAVFGPKPDPQYDGRAWTRGEPHFAPEFETWIRRNCRFLNLIQAGAWLDAAMQLVPEGYNFSVDRIDGRGGAVVNPSSFSSTAAIADAATPALALSAAAIRARSAS